MRPPTWSDDWRCRSILPSGRPGGDLGAAGGAEALEDVAHVRLGREAADAEPLGDLLVREARATSAATSCCRAVRSPASASVGLAAVVSDGARASIRWSASATAAPASSSRPARSCRARSSSLRPASTRDRSRTRSASETNVRCRSPIAAARRAAAVRSPLAARPVANECSTPHTRVSPRRSQSRAGARRSSSPSIAAPARMWAAPSRCAAWLTIR